MHKNESGIEILSTKFEHYDDYQECFCEVTYKQKCICLLGNKECFTESEVSSIVSYVQKFESVPFNDNSDDFCIDIDVQRAFENDNNSIKNGVEIFPINLGDKLYLISIVITEWQERYVDYIIMEIDCSFHTIEESILYVYKNILEILNNNCDDGIYYY